MGGVGRYFRLMGAFARFGLANELAFRANFLVKIGVEVLWLGILLMFFQTIFSKTNAVAGWDQYQYLFFIGCHYALGGVVETFFLENCTNFPELIRTGDLDFILLRPIDEQFLVTTRWVDWSTAPNILLGAGVMGFALHEMQWAFDPVRVTAFAVLFVCGVAMAYSFLLLLTATSVWMIRNQNLMELWWLFTTLMRYPREIYQGRWGFPFGLFFTFVIPVVLVVNVPVHVMVKPLEDGYLLAVMTIGTVVLLWASRRFFRYALQSYRSASS
jgi:ABC-2 type transport system permease protein